jgi:hypothetical protein
MCHAQPNEKMQKHLLIGEHTMQISLYDVKSIQIEEVLFDDFVTRSLRITDEHNNTYTIKMFADDRSSVDFKYKPMRDERENASC